MLGDCAFSALYLATGGFFCKGWCEEWVVLYEDSTLAWFADKSLSRPRGFVRISEAPELLAVGEYTRQVPRKPRFPRACHIGQLLAVGCNTMHDVCWLMGQSPAEINDWMTAISNTLPPPPHLPLEDKRIKYTHHNGMANGHVKPIANGYANGCATIIPNGKCVSATPNVSNSTLHSSKSCSYSSCADQKNYRLQETSRKKKYDNDHTVLAGVCVDWGHGWGWASQAPATVAPQISFAADTAISSALYCPSAEDYTISGYEDVDWSAFGDFCF
ncbi:uncharacterized protein LOC115878475 [Sitophilus oryzae]|uniref:Uncharacterized protein LOC115878475 n=1 Tax=Sitophilus oryzae TaxID=7048 RepID=A0A6J2XHD6_SITOR|nr:uncharacterized protein LOC115878475 [Sitophilus oryzae]